MYRKKEEKESDQKVLLLRPASDMVGIRSRGEGNSRKVQNTRGNGLVSRIFFRRAVRGKKKTDLHPLSEPKGLGVFGPAGPSDRRSSFWGPTVALMIEHRDERFMMKRRSSQGKNKKEGVRSLSYRMSNGRE